MVDASPQRIRYHTERNQYFPGEQRYDTEDSRTSKKLHATDIFRYKIALHAEHDKGSTYLRGESIE